MKLHNLCISLHPWITEELQKNASYDPNSWLYEMHWEETISVFVSSKKELEDFLAIHPSDTILRVVYVGIGKLHISSHIQPWDILLPNTFLSKKSSEVLYVDYAVWEAFDLEKFILHLDGVCTDAFGEISEEFDGDIEESCVYDMLAYISENNLLSKSVVILGTQEAEEYIARLHAIVDMITSE
jgi:hypothetical protein